MACNWKCMADNYQDGNYHVYLCHPGLIGCFDMDKSHNELYDSVTLMCGPNKPRADWPPEGRVDGSLSAAAMETRTRGGSSQSYNMMYPNVFFNRYGCWMSVTNVQPVGENACLTTFDLFFKPQQLADTEFVEMCARAEDSLQKEDIELCLRVGENLRNPLYNAGRYAPIEAPMWWFHQKLHADIFGGDPPGLHHPLPGANSSYMSRQAALYD